MSSGTASPRKPAKHVASYEQFIEDRLERARRTVKSVDIVTRLAALVVGVLAYLLSAAIVDHWLLEGGLGFPGRLAFWLGMVGGGGAYFVRYLLPLLVFRINPVFAAHTIEQNRPGFKNSLINFLLLRRQKEEIEKDDLAKRVYEGLQYRTAAELSHVSVEAAVDRTALVRLSYALAVLVTLCCAYLLISPKNPLVSFGRVVWPWAAIAAPTRVSFDVIEPGDGVAYQGENVVVSAEVYGLREGEPVLLYYSTADGQTVDEAIPMTLPEGAYRYRCEVPPGNLGLQQNIEYFLSAGDCTTRRFAVEMQVPLTMMVDRVEYKYPAYTGLAERTVERAGDLRAVEGTEVTIHATANRPISQAMVEFDGDARNSIPMEWHETAASVRFTLRMNRDDPTRSLYSSYQLRFFDAQRRENRRPIRHRIEVIPDLKPDVRFVDRPADLAAVAEKGSLELKVRAEDLDFGLRRVTLRAEKEGRGLAIADLLNTASGEKAHRGVLERGYPFEPAKLGLKVGDTVLYWAEAFDNKADAKGPTPNHAETEKRSLVIVPNDAQPPKDQAKPPRQEAKPDARQKPDPRQQAGDPGQAGAENQANEGRQPQTAERDRSQGKGKPGSPGKGQADAKDPAQDQQGESKRDEKEPADKTGQGAEKGSEGAREPRNQDSGAGPGESGAAGKRSESSPNEATEENQPVNADTDPAEAVRRILEHRNQQQGDSEKQPANASQRSGPQAGADQQTATTKPDAQSGQESGTAEQRKSGDEPSPKPGKPGAQDSAARDSAAAARQPSEPAGVGEPKPADEAGAEKTGPREPGKDPSGEDPSGKEKGPSSKAQTGQKQSDAALGDNDRQPDERSKPGEQADAQTKQGQDQTKQAQDQAAGKSAKREEGSEPPGGQAGAKGGAEGEDAQGSEEAKLEKPAGKSSRQQGAQGKDEQGGSDQAGSDEKGPKGSRGATGKPKDAQRNPDRGEEGDASKSPGGQGRQATGVRKDDQAKAEEKSSSSPGGKGGKEQEGTEGGNTQPSADSPGAGDSSANPKPTASPQNQPQGHRRPSDAAGDQPRPETEEPSSTARSPKPSDSQGDAGGDRKGGGREGGGQQANRPGVGDAGQHSDSEQGLGKSTQPGQGETGSKAGSQAKSQRPTGSGQKSKDGTGGGKRTEDAGKPGEGQGTDAKSSEVPRGAKPGTPRTQAGQQGAPSKPEGEPAQPSQPTDNAEHAEGSPGAGGAKPSAPGSDPGGESRAPGGGMGSPDASQPPQQPVPPEAALPPDAANLEYAREQTVLALRTLEEELAEQKPELLKRLGWKASDAEKFLRQWQEMMKSANEQGVRGDAARKELDKALRSLGLRPKAMRLRSKTSASDLLQQQDAGRFAPPPGWVEQYRAYTKGAAREGQ